MRPSSKALFSLVLAAVSCSGFAQSFYSYSWLGAGDSTTNGTVTSYLDTQSGSTPVTSQVDGSTTYLDPVGGDIGLTGTAKGRSGYISQGTYASASLTNAHAIASGASNQFYQAAGIAGFSTAFTIYGSSLVENDVYSERFTYSVEGTTESATGIDSHAFIYVHVGEDDAEGSYLYGNSTFQTVEHHFKPGVSNNFQLETSSSVDFWADELDAGSNVSGTTDFYHTVTLQGVDILDGHGNAVKDFEIVDSNTGEKVYGEGTYATPEPASIAAFGFGLAALWRRRRSSGAAGR